MQKKVLEFMEQHHMIKEGERILVAVSGGADSMCLLLVLFQLCTTQKFEICVVHVEHGIRGKESEEDAQFVENFCKMHKIPCKVYHCKAEKYAKEHKMTVEEGARELRYGYFKEAAKEFSADKIAVAHHQNDSAETMLFHLARGTDLKGLCGILPVRENVIRPLLCVERREIEAYLKEQGQAYCMDETNKELEYSRNRIRHQVLPELVQINQQAIGHMNQVAEKAQELEELVEQLTREAWERCVCEKDNDILVSERLRKEKYLIQKKVLYQAITRRAGSSKDISNVHVCQVLELLEKQVRKKVNLPYELEAERTYEGILIHKIQEDVEKILQNTWEVVPGEFVEIPELGYCIHTRIIEGNIQNQEIPQKMYTKWLDYDKIKGSMHLRTRREKDYFIINTRGERKRLKKYLIDEKVPCKQREKILLLADEEHLVWVIGHRIGEDVKVTEHTKRILEIQIDGGNIHE